MQILFFQPLIVTRPSDYSRTWCSGFFLCGLELLCLDISRYARRFTSASSVLTEVQTHSPEVRERGIVKML